VSTYQTQAAGKKPVVFLPLGEQPFDAAAQRGDIRIADPRTVAVILAVHQVAEEVEVVVQTLAVTQANQGIDVVILAANQILVCPAAAQQQPQFALRRVGRISRRAAHYRQPC